MRRGWQPSCSLQRSPCPEGQAGSRRGAGGAGWLHRGRVPGVLGRGSLRGAALPLQVRVKCIPCLLEPSMVPRAQDKTPGPTLKRGRLPPPCLPPPSCPGGQPLGDSGTGALAQSKSSPLLRSPAWGLWGLLGGWQRGAPLALCPQRPLSPAEHGGPSGDPLFGPAAPSVLAKLPVRATRLRWPPAAFGASSEARELDPQQRSPPARGLAHPASAGQARLVPGTLCPRCCKGQQTATRPCVPRCQPVHGD